MTRAQRFSLTLDRAIADEASLLDDMNEWPKGRRQHRIRELLATGMASRKLGRQLGNPFAPSVENEKRKRLVIHLQPGAPDDCKVLGALDDVAASRRNRWLTETLITGLLRRRPDIDLSETEDQVFESAAVITSSESRHEAKPVVSAENVDEVPASAEQTESGRPRLEFLNKLFE